MNWNYFGARYYDPQIGRWVVVDPLAEKHPDFTPYNYVLNNPLRLVDPNGKQVDFYDMLLIDQGLREKGYSEQVIQDLHEDQARGTLLGAAIGIGAVLGWETAPYLIGLALSRPVETTEIITGALTPGAENLGVGGIPHGFASAAEFENFGAKLTAGLEKAGFGDVKALFQGSSVTGKKFTTGEAFDVGRLSDFDVALAGPNLLAKAKELGMSLRSGGTRTGPLSPGDLKKLGLDKLAEQLSKSAGRPVNFMIYESAEAAAQRSPSIQVP